MKRFWKFEYIVLALGILLYLSTFWTLGTSMQRLDVRIYRLEVAVKSLNRRTTERWTRADHTLWTQALQKANPQLIIPPVPTKPDLSGLPEAPSLPGVKATQEGVKP